MRQKEIEDFLNSLDVENIAVEQDMGYDEEVYYMAMELSKPYKFIVTSLFGTTVCYANCVLIYPKMEKAIFMADDIEYLTSDIPKIQNIDIRECSQQDFDYFVEDLKERRMFV